VLQTLHSTKLAWFCSLAFGNLLFAVVGCGTGSDSASPNADGSSGGALPLGAGSGNSAAGAGGHTTSGGAQNSGGGASGAPPVGSQGGTAGVSVVGMAGGVSGGVSNEPDPVGTTVPWGTPTLPSGRGAIEPYTEYEAEAGTLTGATLLGPTRTGNSINDVAAEASNRQAVRLANTNDSVTIKNLNPSNSIVVRYSVPDNGLDYTGTLSLYVNGTMRQKLTVTSRYSWTYGGVNDFNNVAVEKNVGAGSPHHFFDEVHALTGDIPVGASVKLQKDADDNAAHYDIDLIDMEQVASAPAAKPAGFMSIVDCGAIPNDGKDDGPAIQLCFTRSKSLYIPEGVFDMTSKEVSAQGATIRGAGMWRSVLKGFFARFDCYAGGCKFYDFAIDGDSTHRDDDSPETGFTGNGMSGSLIEHVWVEHKKLGVWTGSNTNGITIRNSRFRDLYADGINLSCGTSNALIEHTNIRNSGDDSFAAWSLNTCANEQNNTFRNVYAQLPWRANCFGIYGGSTTIQDSVCSDTQYPGILLGAMFNSNAFTATKVSGVSLIRAGGPQYGEQGALKLDPEQGPVQNVQISNVDIDSATYSAVQFAAGNTIDTVSLAGVNITKPGGCGLLAQGGGAADMSNVVVSGAGSGLCNEKGFNFIKGAGNSGW